MSSAAEPILDRIREEDQVAPCSFGGPQDKYFRAHAFANDRRGISRAYVLRDAERSAILGFFALSMADVASDDLPQPIRRGLPRYPLPVALIGQLAV